MFVGLKVQTAPTTTPVSVATAMQHCRVDQTTDQALIGTYLAAAVEQAEGYLGRALITQTLIQTMGPERSADPGGYWQLPFDPVGYWSFPWGRPYALLRAPVQSISSVTVLDVYGNSTAVQPGNYGIVPPTRGYQADLAKEPSRLWIDPDLVLTASAAGVGGGAFSATGIQNVQITFVAGYGNDGTNVPNSIINAILLQTGWLYEHRGDDGAELSPAVERLLNRYRLFSFA